MWIQESRKRTFGRGGMGRTQQPSKQQLNEKKESEGGNGSQKKHENEKARKNLGAALTDAKRERRKKGQGKQG